VFTESLPSDNNGNTDTDTEQCDLIILLLFFRRRKICKETFGPAYAYKITKVLAYRYRILFNVVA
jgi:hypothetical protein